VLDGRQEEEPHPSLDGAVVKGLWMNRPDFVGVRPGVTSAEANASMNSTATAVVVTFIDANKNDVVGVAGRSCADLSGVARGFERLTLPPATGLRRPGLSPSTAPPTSFERTMSERDVRNSFLVRTEADHRVCRARRA
jgi:hypothetical protein